MRRGGPLDLIRDAWWAASAPASFFHTLQQKPAPELWRAVLAALLAVLLALAVLSLAFVRATASDGWLLVWLLACGIGVPYLAMVLLLGGLVMVRPANLDLRAWEIAGWAWVPAGALALSLAPAAYFAPLPAAALGLLVFPFWHVVLVVSGVSVFAPTRRVITTVIYLIAVFLVPALVTAVSYAVMSGMQP